LWPIIVVYVLKFDELNKAYLLVGTIVLITMALIAYLINLHLYLQDEEEFIISEGFLIKDKTIIQLDKINR
jgi:putative membrane protein